jgi:succinyl-diaminopimelate desuccinylase
MRELIEAAGELIRVRSTAERGGGDQLERAVELVVARGVPGSFVVERFLSRGKPSVLVRPPGPRPHFRVLFNAHADVVPGGDEQFEPRVEGNRLYGRGAQDMKVAALVMAEVFREVAGELPFPAGLQVVADEEVGGFHGTAHQIAEGVTADVVVIGEQSGLRVETANRAFNQVPSAATAWVDIRFTPEDPDLAGKAERDVVSYLEGLCGVRVSVANLGPPHWARPDGADVRLLQAAARAEGFGGDFLRKHGAADGRFYHAAGTDALIFGPGGDGQHGPHEYVDLETVEPYRRALTAFLRSLR